jgi:hypothetical protein
VGERAPYFSLPSLAGPWVTRNSLRGKVSVLVIGRTLKAAPPCKRWGIELSRTTKAAVYQVVVADKPWYAPRSAVLKKVRGFSPRQYDANVLVEYYTVFADAYGIPRVDDPYVLVLDRRMVIRERLRAQPTKAHVARIKAIIAKLIRASKR